MRRARTILLLLVLTLSAATAIEGHAAGLRTVSAQGSEIIVEVTDQGGVFYSGVQVQIWQQSGNLLYSGTTQNGFFSSGDLSSNTNYLVIVSTGFQSLNKTVFVGTTNTLVTFVLNRPLSPDLQLSEVTFAPSTVSPGSTFTAQIVINSTGGTAYNSVIAFNSSTPAGVSISGSGSTLSLGTISANSTKSLSPTFSVVATALTGDYQVPYTLKYYNSTRGLFSSSGFITVSVSGVPSRPVLIISNISFSPSIITPGLIFTTNINVSNTGSQPAYSATIALLIPSQNITLIGSTGQYTVGVLPANSSQVVSFRMTSPANSQSGAVPVGFAILYNNKFGTVFNTNGTFSIALTATPDLQVESFSMGSSTLVPGGTYDLTVGVLNVGGDTAYSVSLSVIGSHFLQGNFSNYLGAVLSQSAGKAVFVLNVANNTQPGTYGFTLSIKYTDIAGRTYTSIDNYTLAVSPYPSPQVSITNILVDPPVLSTGTSGSITLFFKNFGSSSAQNVTVSVNGGNGIVSSNYFGLGTISSGGQVTQVIGVNVIPTAVAGNRTIMFNVSYQDATGAVYHSSVPMALSIYESANLFSTKNILIVVGIVILALIGLVLISRFKILERLFGGSGV